MTDPNSQSTEVPASDQALSTVVEAVASADRRLVTSDFDGTLAEIVPHPDDATIKPDARSALEAVSSDPHTEVAVVSGRAKDDIEERVDLPGIWHAGNHGLEISADGETFVHPEAAEARSAIEAACEELEDRLDDVGGAFVEPKGLTATVHYRRVEEDAVEDVQQNVRHVVDRYASAIDIHDGKQVLELRPALEWNKGRAVEWILETAYDDPTDVHPVYVGDDVSDEAAFRALDDTGSAVRVGDAASAAAADVTLADPDAVAGFFDRLVDAVNPP